MEHGWVHPQDIDRVSFYQPFKIYDKVVVVPTVSRDPGYKGTSIEGGGGYGVLGKIFSVGKFDWKNVSVYEMSRKNILLAQK